MAENKTRMTHASVPAYLAAIEDFDRRQECEALTSLLEKATANKNNHAPLKMRNERAFAKQNRLPQPRKDGQRAGDC